MANEVLRAAARPWLLLAVLWIMGTLAVRASGPPPAADQPPSLGKATYERYCTMCHGADGKGDGLAADMVLPHPRDLTSGKYKFRSTESGSIPTDADIERTISRGLSATAMPDWSSFIGGDTLKQLVEYVKSLSPRFGRETPKPIGAMRPVPSSPASIAAGKTAYDKLKCWSCHGTDGTGTGAIAHDLHDDLGHEISASNLTEPWTFRGGSSPEDIALRLCTGIDGTPMPSYLGAATDKEIGDLANYIASLKRKPIWEMDPVELTSHFSERSRQAAAHPVERGKYLVAIMGCADCHTPFDSSGRPIDDLRLAGGLKWSLGPYGVIYSPNLTSDKETGLGGWTDDEIKRGMTRGIRKDGSRSIPFPMPWTSYANLSNDDLNAIIAYLRTVPPQHNRIPEPEPLNIFSYLWAKFKMLILKEDFPTSASAGVGERPATSEAKEAGR